ncbi:MAG: alpha-ribazole phosphatase family protein [Pseudomonas sp.]|uniref:alpha-ribazole phosphatase family protein n=1 Tax=Pseudomonas sp. TaxID=306 RepID=UPI00339A28AC
MTLHLDLLRHGETERGGGFRGSLDDQLTEQGWAQMRVALDGRKGWARIVSSPLQRCARFASELAGRLQIPLHLDARLSELHFGAWEGRSAAALMDTEADALGQFWRDPYEFTPPDGEPVAAFAQRVLLAIDDLHRQFAGQSVLLVSHAGVMRLLLARARGLPREQLLQVEVAHAALFALRVTGPAPLCLVEP